MMRTCKRVPWMWFCCIPGPAFAGRSSSSILMVEGTSVTRTNGTRALAAISRVRYTADREHLEHRRFLFVFLLNRQTLQVEKKELKCHHI